MDWKIHGRGGDGGTGAPDAAGRSGGIGPPLTCTAKTNHALHTTTMPAASHHRKYTRPWHAGQEVQLYTLHHTPGGGAGEVGFNDTDTFVSFAHAFGLPQVARDGPDAFHALMAHAAKRMLREGVESTIRGSRVLDAFGPGCVRNGGRLDLLDQSSRAREEHEAVCTARCERCDCG